MGIFSTGRFCRFDEFQGGKYNEIFKKATFTAKKSGKKVKKPSEVCDLIITADTETSHTFTGEAWAEYFPAPEVAYLSGLTIKVPTAVRSEYADFEFIRRKAFGFRLYLNNKKGHDIEELYSELVRLFGWSDDLTHPADKLSFILDFLERDREDKESAAAAEPKEVGWIYQWAICVYFESSPLLIYGRKPGDFSATLAHMCKLLKLSKKRRASVYFHNFSYDYQYLKKFICRDLDPGGKVGAKFRILATEPHKILSWNTSSGITFKCSYRLSNASLDFWARKIVFSKYKKLVGAVDYELVRFQDTPLKRQDWRYMFYDVLVDAECIHKSAKAEGDSMATIPLTSTGYVRRDGRRFFRKDKKARKNFKKCALNVAAYNVLKAAQAGGYTHTNRFIAGRTIDLNDEDFKKRYPEITNIKHGDERSFYPTSERCELYPVGKFIKYCKDPEIEEVKRLLKDESHAYIFVVAFSGVELRKGEVFPIISESKARKGACEKLDTIDDNGRILKCEGTFILSLTNMDFELILKQYNCEYSVLEVWRARAGYLPDWMYALIDSYFKGKSDFKDQSREHPEDEDIQALLMKSKNKLNGIYGMSATDPVRDSFFEDAAGEWTKKEADRAAELAKFYNSENSFMRLEWGVWCTSWSRYRLLELAGLIGWKYVLYSDTDSIFYLSNEEIENKIAAYNAAHNKRALDHGAYITTEKGKRIFYDVFEDEGENIIKFRALHSKCYAYVTDDGALHCTIAGVNKKGRAEELGSIENLKDGFTFKKCGGTTVKYYEDEITTEEIEGHRIERAGAAIICKVDKTIKYNPYEFPEVAQWQAYDADELLR